MEFQIGKDGTSKFAKPNVCKARKLARDVQGIGA
jgi:hypothetical protein